MTNFEFKAGVIDSPKDERDYQLNDLIAGAGLTAVPETYVNPLLDSVTILNQGQSNMCVACSLTYLRWLTEYSQSANRNQFSPAYIYGNRDSFGYMGEGMIPREALSRLKDYGTCFYNDFSGFYDVKTAINLYRQKKSDLDPKAKPYRISSYYAVSGVEGIKQGVYRLGGVMVSYPMFNCLCYPDKNGYVNYNLKNLGTSLGNHAMTIVGWTETHWIVLNSWGSWWGKNGICYIPFEWAPIEAWAVVDEVMEVIIKMARFIDTEGHWAEKSIDKAAEKGAVSGFEDGSFQPDANITRAQLCSILDRLGLLD